MRGRTLVWRGLAHYRGTHAAVVLGVAIAVAVLAGALLVGESLRGSLQAQVLRRLGRTDHALLATRFFREALAGDIAAQAGLAAVPALLHAGVVTAADTGRRAGGVDVWGVDARFWEFHGVAMPGSSGREALVSRALADELGLGAGGAVLLRVRADEDVSGASLFGRRDDPAQAIRLTVRDVLTPDRLGELALRPRQQPVKAMFVPLALLQRILKRPGQANVVLLAGDPRAVVEAQAAVGRAAQLVDLGLRLRPVTGTGDLVLQADGAQVGQAVATPARGAATEAGLQVTGVLVHLANAIRVGGRSVPYSTVAGIEDPGDFFAGASSSEPPLVLNEWAARDLGARPGDPVTLEYYVWLDEGRMETRTTAFRLTRVVPVVPGDRDLVPDFPGITESLHMADWEPPFPVDLSQIRPADEAYWNAHGPTPKAFVPLAVAQRLWGSRGEPVTSLRLTTRAALPAEQAARDFGRALQSRLDVQALGLRVEPVRAQGLAAAQGSTEFGEYFLYFSFFLVMSALLLAGLFFRLGIEQRLPEIGLLRAVGFSEARLRGLLLAEGLATSAMGALLGVAGATAWASLLLLGLRTVWQDAMGTRDIDLHVRAGPLVVGALGGIVAAGVTGLLTLRGLRGMSPRALLKAARTEREEAVRPWLARGGLLLASLALVLLGLGVMGRVAAGAAFFGAGALVLGALLVLIRVSLVGEPPWSKTFTSPRHLGLRGAAFRPGRTVVSVALLASATFLIVAVGAFRHGTHAGGEGPQSSGGGYAYVATSLVALHHDPATSDGWQALGLASDTLADARVDRFRMRQGDDASCLNLYAPQSPTVLAPHPAFVKQARFAFSDSLARTEAQKANPWLLLDEDGGDAVPVIADASSLRYILKKRLGDTITLAGSGLTVRFVAALAPGLFQGELLMGERHFTRAFPSESGYRFFLIEAPPARAEAVASGLESKLSDFGFDAATVRDRLAAYHRVENTYIATFQALGGLALVLGTLGTAAVLMRNALEQRRELGLLRAVGFRHRDVARQLAAENALVLGLGLAAGTLSAALAILPALAERGGSVPVLGILGLLAAVSLSGFVSTRAATAMVTRRPVLEALRSE